MPRDLLAQQPRDLLAGRAPRDVMAQAVDTYSMIPGNGEFPEAVRSPTAPVVDESSRGSFMERLARGALSSTGELYRGATALGALPFDALMALHNRTTGPLEAKMTGREFRPLPNMSQQRDQAMRDMGIPEPQGPVQEALGAAMRGIGGSLPTMGMGALWSGSGGALGGVGQTLAAQPMTQIAAGAGAGASSDIVRQMGGGPLTQMGAGLAGGMATGGIASALSGRPPAPSLEELRASARRAYREADNSGVVVSRSSIQNVADDMERGVRELGYDPGLNPEISALLRRVADDSADDMSLSQLEILRKVFKGAADSDSNHTQMLAYSMIGKLDDFVNNLKASDTLSGDPASGQLLSTARNFYSRYARGEEIAQLMENASIRGRRNISLTGYEQALRTEFGRIALNPNRLRLFTPMEQEAIKQVATGGGYLSPVNLLRTLGKFAPTNTVSIGSGAGLGYLMGGPVGAAAVPVAGGLARLAATGLTMRNANLVSELARRGSQAVPPGGGVLLPNVAPATFAAQQPFIEWARERQ
jgi:hypothetical protein